MYKIKILHIEVLLLLTSVVTAFLWALDPEGSYEPFFALSSTLAILCEYTRHKNINAIALSVISESKTVVDSKPKPKQRTTKAKEIRAKRISTNNLSVEQISNAINDASPFQRKNIAESYIGINVCYVGYFNKVEEDYKDKNKIRVNCKTKQKGLHSFYFTTTLDEFPEIKVLEKGHEIEVSGSIEGASGEGLLVYINPSEINFLQSA